MTSSPRGRPSGRPGRRGRVFGAFSAVEGIAMLGGTLTAGYLSRPLGIIPVLAVQGAGYVLAGLGMTVWLHHRADPGQARIPAGNAARTRKPPVQKEPLGGIVRP